MNTEAQENLSELTAPQSPASTVLGLQPSTITSPKSFKELEATLVNKFSENNNFVVPNDFALEFSPYYSGKKKLNPADFYDYNGWSSAKRNLSFSLASTNNYVILDSANTNAIAFGARTFFEFGKSKKENAALRFRDIQLNNRLRVKISRVADEIVEDNKGLNAETFIQKLEDELKAPGILNDQGSKSAVDSLIVYLKENLESVSGELSRMGTDTGQDGFSDFLDTRLGIDAQIKEMQEILAERKNGLEIAYANLLNFPTQEAEYSYLSKHSFWATVHFSGSSIFNKVQGQGLGKIDASLVFRRTWDQRDFHVRYVGSRQFGTRSDVGGKLSFVADRLSIDTEFIHGWSKRIDTSTIDPQTGDFTEVGNKQESNQFLLSFHYMLNSNTSISYTWGEQFAFEIGEGTNLVSLLALSQSFGGPKTDPKDESRFLR